MVVGQRGAETRSAAAQGGPARLRAVPTGQLMSRPLPFWKRAMDILGALVVIVLVAPLILLVALAIAVDSRGGVLYRQERVGRGGASFTTWKFRSMRVGADRELATLRAQNEASGHIFKMKGDPRVTRVGRVLRKTSLDELPQVWNVLRGDMSLVGPRPPLPAEVAHYEPPHLRRLEGVPGVTGLWQVTARHEHDFEQMVALDLAYLERITLLGDLKILLRTVPTVLFARGSY